MGRCEDVIYLQMHRIYAPENSWFLVKTVIQAVKKSSAFMKFEDSQGIYTVLYPKPDESSIHRHNPFI